MIYDCFIFFNELDLLELRLNVLDPVVDRFVLVEATRTFQGREKPLFFSDNKHRFKDFLGKIIHVAVTEYPDNPARDPWLLETHQRGMIMEGLRDCDPRDVILISDVDEIPDPAEVGNAVDKRLVRIFRHRLFYYFLNCEIVAGAEIPNRDSPGTVMTRFSELGNGVQGLRDLGFLAPNVGGQRPLQKFLLKFWLLRNATVKGIRIEFIGNAGWHFSFLGGVEKIVEKLESFSHAEYNTGEFKDAKKIRECMEFGRDILGRDFRYRCIPLDPTFPEYLLKNIERYEHLLCGVQCGDCS